ncbi:hypothetical protein JMJ77_0008254 [Colletotrichum scovillei]|uniref:Uncharacterized protein n=1 Tax=Colletotrichum scovillei TaxID=1209932 RepID=A0A9P7REF3_9PEZI|nr:hypothetical protein JMJ77_0008254 [Colletotrichum scovillei]KAG7075245.1 hypothetical protein JMJ76_0011706 [Colletotrichum scovillei]KAG7082240.1 hypothetical protein JMJ78_0004343 [Colletotrichum scovillei]
MQSFSSPACRKVLPPRAEGEEASTPVSPPWTRKEGLSVISTSSKALRRRILLKLTASRLALLLSSGMNRT